jgi:transketolase
MTTQERIKKWKLHPSQRGWFSFELYKAMVKDPTIWLICIDLGYSIYDFHFEDFPDRCINTGAAETAAMDIAVGLALSGKKPFVYSITPFLIYRPFETIRLYLNHEKIGVRMVGSGRDQDYKHDGISHDASDVYGYLALLDNIRKFYPKWKDEIPKIVNYMAANNKPQFISLRR